MILIGIIAVLVLGPQRLPEFFRTLGRITASLRRAADDFRREIDRYDIDLRAELRQKDGAARSAPARQALPGTVSAEKGVGRRGEEASAASGEGESDKSERMSSSREVREEDVREKGGD
ncbi:MAG: hypothetical protein D6679_02495 [Candidatus Hydrogenedentota bacterium]|nr:MAG: hypothetical protein D6679_02495 [Candidatus Hydrogenedentota bacterium]